MLVPDDVALSSSAEWGPISSLLLRRWTQTWPASLHWPGTAFVTPNASRQTFTKPSSLRESAVSCTDVSHCHNITFKLNNWWNRWPIRFYHSIVVNHDSEAYKSKRPLSHEFYSFEWIGRSLCSYKMLRISNSVS